MSWKKTISLVAADVEAHFDQLKNDLRQKLNLNQDRVIVPYHSYGTQDKLVVRGRLLDNKEIISNDADNLWDNLLNTLQRINSHEVPNALISISFQGETWETTTNEEGFFHETVMLTKPLAENALWHTIQLSHIKDDGVEIGCDAQIIIPPAAATFGIISDIDDTVLQSNATNLLNAARLMFLGNAYNRLPFIGAATFYQALQTSVHTKATNPIFYVSSSPWNLYDFLTQFFTIQQIPEGPLFLLDYGITADHLLAASHKEHKLAQIDTLLQTYPNLPFILIGDSGQKDPEIYQSVVEKYPTRIQTIYIRDVTNDKRDAEVVAIAQDVTQQGIPMFLVPDSVVAAVHASAQGWITQEQLTQIAQEKANSEPGPSMVEQSLTD